MKLLKLAIKNTDTKGIYYKADDHHKAGAVTTLPKTHDFTLVIRISKTIHGRKIHKAKAQKFTKGIAQRSALEQITVVKSKVREELEEAATAIAIDQKETMLTQEYQKADRTGRQKLMVKSRQAKKADEERQTAPKTLNRAWLEYQEHLSKKGVVEGTLKGYRSFYKKNLQPTLGRIEVEHVTTAHIQAAIQVAIDRGLAARTVRTAREILRPLFRKERDDPNSRVQTNPETNVIYPAFNNQRNIEITDKQAAAVYKAIWNHDDETIRSIFIFMAHGRRGKEVLTLEWENVDLQAGKYTIAASKNKAGRSMSYLLTDEQREALPTPSTGYVFLRERTRGAMIGKGLLPVTHDQLRKPWLETMQAAEDSLPEDQRTFILNTEKTPISKLHSHDLRHVLGGRSVSKGMSLEKVAATLGHTNTRITARYSKVREAAANETVENHFKDLL